MIEAIITGIVAIAVCMINNAFQQKRADEQHNTTIALIEYKLNQLEHKDVYIYSWMNQKCLNH